VDASELTALRHFGHLGDERAEALFERTPGPLRRPGNPAHASATLGAMLYCPAIQPDAAQRLLNGYWPGLTAMAFCLEDSIGDRDLADAEDQVTDLLRAIEATVQHAGERDQLPYVFVRVRGPEHLERLLARWGRLSDGIDGIMLPKIGAEHLARYVDTIRGAQAGRDRPLWALPILEGADIALRETRLAALHAVAQRVREDRALIPCVRIGATDLSGLWALRRPRDFTIYDISVVRDIIADIVNVLGRDPDGPAISGPVWEYIREDPLFKPRLRETPFEIEFGPEEGPQMRQTLVANAIDGLLRETLLDRANGLHGKTVIHPAHIAPVDAAHAVTHEEWTSAVEILDAIAAGNGVSASANGPRMNEPKPHAHWAARTLARAEAFGVLRREHTFLALLENT
jgi:citrate lyase beta subunit